MLGKPAEAKSTALIVAGTEVKKPRWLHASTSASSSTISKPRWLHASMKLNAHDYESVSGAADDDTNNNDADSGKSDTVVYQIMDEMKLECFKDLDDVNSIIDAYEARTGNCLRIEKSEKGTFRVYRCCEHVQCTYQVRFSRRQLDGLFVLSKASVKHHGVQRLSRGADGRRRKQRR
jgi:hypothetical protein